MHKALVDHIKERLESGQDIRFIRNHLISRGFAKQEVHEAIDYVYMELQVLESDIQKAEKKAVKEVEHFYYPTKAKLIIPFIFFCLLVVHFFININSLPLVGKNLCEEVKISDITSPYIETPGPEEVMKSSVVELSLVEDLNLLLLANYPLIATKVHLLSPLFPLPCELSGFTEAKGCMYYMAKEDYECISSGISDNPTSGVSRFFEGSLPPYKPISLNSIILSSIIVLLVGYVLNCVCVFGYREVKHEHGKKLLEWAISLGLLIFVVVLVFGYIYILRILTR